MVTLGEVLSLATPQGITMICFLWGNFYFYGSLDRGKINLRQLCTLRCLVTLTHIPSPWPCSLLQISLFIILLTRNPMPSKIVFP